MHVNVCAALLYLCLVVVCGGETVGITNREAQRVRKNDRLQETVEELKIELRELLTERNVCNAASEQVDIPDVLKVPTQSYRTWSERHTTLKGTIDELKTEIRRVENIAIGTECDKGLVVSAAQSAPGTSGDGREGPLDPIFSPGQTASSSSFPAPSGWLERACSADRECPVVHAECFKGKCLCTPGYYFSTGSKTCLADIEDVL